VSEALPFPAGVDEILRREWPKVVATLVRLTGSVDRAEDACADAVVEAVTRWPTIGIPERPGAWLTTVARRKALDVIRRESGRAERERAALLEAEVDAAIEHHTVRDDTLRLIFTCCHPALAADAHVPLALRLLCGLTTVEIAAALMADEATVGKRITRAKAKIAATGLGARIPPDRELPDRLSSVLDTVSIMLATGHHAPGPSLQRVELAHEALRLAELLVELMPDEPECVGLLALALSTVARMPGRVDGYGALVVLDDVDRSQWDRSMIDRAVELTHIALRRGRPGRYQLQAAISCLHAVAPDVAGTDWAQIVTLYDALLALAPSPAVVVNRAVAIARRDGPHAGLAALSDAPQQWVRTLLVRGELLVRSGVVADGVAALRSALAATSSPIEQAHLMRRITQLSTAPP
jgi:RNA polymerase sigma-70 factor, ECF subfamily